jgi:hypothetical protein
MKILWEIKADMIFEAAKEVGEKWMTKLISYLSSSYANESNISLFILLFFPLKLVMVWSPCSF